MVYVVMYVWFLPRPLQLELHRKALARPGEAGRANPPLSGCAFDYRNIES